MMITGRGPNVCNNYLTMPADAEGVGCDDAATVALLVLMILTAAFMMTTLVAVL